MIFNPECIKSRLLAELHPDKTRCGSPNPIAGLGRGPREMCKRRGKQKGDGDREEWIYREKRREEKGRESGNWRGKEGT